MNKGDWVRVNDTFGKIMWIQNKGTNEEAAPTNKVKINTLNEEGLVKTLEACLGDCQPLDTPPMLIVDTNKLKDVGKLEPGKVFKLK